MINSFKFAREMLLQSDKYLGRPKDKISERISGMGGLVMTDGDAWRVHRRFSLRVLRDFGFGKNLSQERIQVRSPHPPHFPQSHVEHFQCEIGHLCNGIEALGLETAIDTNEVLALAMANVICQFVFGERLNEKDDFQVSRESRHPVSIVSPHA